MVRKPYSEPMAEIAPQVAASRSHIIIFTRVLSFFPDSVSNGQTANGKELKMKKMLGIAVILILSAGICHAGDAFSIAVGPGGFGLYIGSDYGGWHPRPPGPPPGYYAYGWPPPFRWNRPYWKRHPPRGRYFRTLPPRYHQPPPGHFRPPGHPGGRRGGPHPR